MSKKLLALLVGCAMALCLGLVGCGGSGSGGGAAEEQQDLTGVWDIQNMEDFLGQALGESGMEVTDEMMASMSDVVKKICFLQLNDDGTFALVAMTQAIEGTYKVDGGSVTLEAEGSPVTGTLDGDTITIDENGTKMVFAKSADKTRTVPSEEELQQELMGLVMQMMGAAA